MIAESTNAIFMPFYNRDSSSSSPGIPSGRGIASGTMLWNVEGAENTVEAMILETKEVGEG